MKKTNRICGLLLACSFSFVGCGPSSASPRNINDVPEDEQRKILCKLVGLNEIEYLQTYTRKLPTDTLDIKEETREMYKEFNVVASLETGERLHQIATEKEWECPGYGDSSD